MYYLIDELTMLSGRLRDWMTIRHEGALRLALRFMTGAIGGLITAAIFMTFSAEIVMLVSAAPGTAMVSASVGGMFGLMGRMKQAHKPWRPLQTRYASVNPWPGRY